MKNSKLASLLLTALVCTLSLPACKTGSTLLSNEQTIEPQPPRVSCKQPATKIVTRAPRADEWVDTIPTLDGQDRARLSEKAVAWIRDLLGIVDKEREYRGIEHRCLDEHEKKGDILQ